MEHLPLLRDLLNLAKAGELFDPEQLEQMDRHLRRREVEAEMKARRTNCYYRDASEPPLASSH